MDDQKTAQPSQPTSWFKPKQTGQINPIQNQNQPQSAQPKTQPVFNTPKQKQTPQEIQQPQTSSPVKQTTPVQTQQPQQQPQTIKSTGQAEQIQTEKTMPAQVPPERQPKTQPQFNPIKQPKPQPVSQTLQQKQPQAPQPPKQAEQIQTIQPQPIKTQPVPQIKQQTQTPPPVKPIEPISQNQPQQTEQQPQPIKPIEKIKPVQNQNKTQQTNFPQQKKVEAVQTQDFTMQEVDDKKEMPVNGLLKLGYIVLFLMIFTGGAFFISRKIFAQRGANLENSEVLLSSRYQPVLWKDFGEVFEPMIKVPIKYPQQGFQKKEFLLDSGALVSSLPREEAKKMGLSLAKLKRSTFAGFGGTTSFAYKASINAQLGEKEISMPVVFTEAGGTKPILGRSGFFEKYNIHFNARAKMIEIRE